MNLSSYPHLVKEWHPTKNGELTPKNFTFGSNKKIWWQCSKKHNFESIIRSRTIQKSGCPYCSGRKASQNNNLLVSFPETAKEWHPIKNGKLRPSDFTRGSDKKIWWLCPKNHSYEARISQRTRKKQPNNCPYCSGQKVGKDNNLLFLFPDIAKEWHPTKNGKLMPNEVTRGSEKKVWWLCSKNHSYEAMISNRTTKNSGCPLCSNQSSQPEIRILCELKWVFDEVVNRYKLKGVEIDIYLPNLNVGIEYDGKYWHKNIKEVDLKKNDFLLSQKINLIRVREYPLSSLSENDLIVNTPIDKSDIDNILKKICPIASENQKKKINNYLIKSSFVNEQLFNKYISYFPSPFPENSLEKTHKLVSSEWDYEKNNPLTPKNFSFGSAIKVWWLCPEGHSYDSTINSRTRGGHCPICSGHRVGKDNNLLFLFPDIAKEWHPTKNGKLRPNEFTRGSEKKVWWLCSKGHSYSSAIGGRTGRNRGCPYCSGREASDDNNLLILFPKVAKEWHPTKNKGLTPSKVTSKSSKKAWWLCPKGHNYKTVINYRTGKNTGCPYCAGQKSLNLDLFK